MGIWDELEKEGRILSIMGLEQQLIITKAIRDQTLSSNSKLGGLLMFLQIIATFHTIKRMVSIEFLAV